MNWINTILIVVFYTNFVNSKCPAPFPGEHGPCMRTCGQHKVCSAGLWCCDTPCGGTVCKIPNLPQEPVYRHVPQQPRHRLSSHIMNQPPPLQAATRFHSVPEISLFNQQQQVLSPNFLTGLQPLQNNLRNIGQSNGILQHFQKHNIPQASTFQTQAPFFGVSSHLKADSFQHLIPTNINSRRNIHVGGPINAGFPRDSRLMDFSTPPKSHFDIGRPKTNHLSSKPFQHPQASQPIQTSTIGGETLTTLNGRCSPDQPKVKCWHDPCKVTTCPLFPESVCVIYYCGECQAKFTIDGVDITHYCHV